MHDQVAREVEHVLRMVGEVYGQHLGIGFEEGFLCREDQVAREVEDVLRMVGEVYGVFGLTYKLALSTRPATYLGALEVWDRAEAALTNALNATGLPWEVRMLGFCNSSLMVSGCAQPVVLKAIGLPWVRKLRFSSSLTVHRC